MSAGTRALDNRLLAGVSAWVALALAIWFVGAALPAAARIGLIALLPAAWFLRQSMRAARARAALGGTLAKVAPAGAPSVEAIAALPWYAFIGAPGSGKTTALLRSGLRFRAGADAAALAGIGGTRNCDWWFAEEAVLLDTAGRYTTRDSDTRADAAAWFEFLHGLRAARPQQPLNGVFVTVSASDLMLWSKKERERYAAHVRMRLAEMHAALSQRVPVYVLVTKCDLLAGFMEFFADLDAAGRAQVWGTTFAHGEEPGPEDIETRCGQALADLDRVLGAETIDRLSEEPDLQRRAAIFRFPQQFFALHPLLLEFLRAAFNYRQDHQSALLRGVYFTSGTQHGNPIDRVLAAIARGVGLSRAAVASPDGKGQSYFITALLRDVVLREADLASWHLGAPTQGASCAVAQDRLPR